MRLVVIAPGSVKEFVYNVDYWAIDNGTLLLYQDSATATTISRDVVAAIAQGNWAMATVDKSK
jgi:hypothetical protein